MLETLQKFYKMYKTSKFPQNLQNSTKTKNNWTIEPEPLISRRELGHEFPRASAFKIRRRWMSVNARVVRARITRESSSFGHRSADPHCIALDCTAIAPHCTSLHRIAWPKQTRNSNLCKLTLNISDRMRFQVQYIAINLNVSRLKKENSDSLA